MPDLVGRNADIARTAPRAADHVSVVDLATGRPALLYSAYKVCGRSPKPGAEMSGQPVTLRAIGTCEDCP
ncbi:PASTA domain-containing protein [Streptomyces cocklensis]|jgi:hypothetical protein|uniref:Uncharacterized protein n=1 Tax=Actinacidiphila cocklensis TaxID=887465 RepID=A0A9W4GN11_9ACTN|nr:PASTA domain-containing protein [Actinacidiphila cocklensis]MDD1058598.1 PASTA domain-containing protein [Actinacidiphila cocklensis]WSX75193.1 PASTA domain-containing protein [Streptomyces sp. NBC_00899]CAG6390775.1 hypothetical protein SCOCK_10243 [Actinacidiphila cocklensis]